MPSSTLYYSGFCVALSRPSQLSHFQAKSLLIHHTNSIPLNLIIFATSITLGAAACARVGTKWGWQGGEVGGYGKEYSKTLLAALSSFISLVNSGNCIFTIQPFSSSSTNPCETSWQFCFTIISKNFVIWNNMNVLCYVVSFIYL